VYINYERTKLDTTPEFRWDVEYLRGDAGAGELTEVMAGDWTSVKTTGPRSVDVETVDWLRVKIESRVSYPAIANVLIGNPTLDSVDLYQLDSASNVVQRHYLGNSRDLAWVSSYSSPKISIQLKPFEQTSVYLKAVTRHGSALPVLIYNDYGLHEHQQKLLLLWGGFLGLSLIMTLYYLSLYRAMKERIYLDYAIFTLVTLVFLASLYGFGFHLFPIALQRAFSAHLGSISLLLIGSIVLFTRRFISIDRTASTTRTKVLTIVLMSLLPLGTWWFPDRWVLVFSVFLQPMLFIYLVSVAIRSLQNRTDWAQFYLLSWLPVFIGLPLTSLSYLDWIESTFLTRYAFFFSIIVHLTFSALSFSERMRATEQRRIYQATHDRYTRLPNRSALNQAMTQWIEHETEFSLVFIEVGNFLRFLPYVGSERAAQLVSAVAELVRESCTLPTDPVEVELVSFMPPYLLRDHLLAIIVPTERLAETMAELLVQCERDVTVSGIEISVNPIVASASYPHHGLVVEDLVQKTMQTLAFAKKEGLAQAIYYEEWIQHSELEVRIAIDLRRALQNNELQLFHQPQIVLDDFSVFGSEVLLRWQHPQLGFISPEVFVKVAEEIGMIGDLTLWVIGRALQQQQQLVALGYSHHLSINISGKDVQRSGFFEEVEQLLNRYKIDASMVTLELTETVTVQDRQALKKLMAQFEKLGLRFSIDDFGTGFSSLEALSELNFNELKIDRTFVVDMLGSPRNYTIASATIELANRLELATVAEGVENEQIVVMLKNCNCKIAQGYYFSRPLSFPDYQLWLKREAIG